MTEGGKRRDGILSLLEESDTPLSGTELAHRFKVSRQVIVQDIALLRAEDKKILSTYRGYVLDRESEKKEKMYPGVLRLPFYQRYPGRTSDHCRLWWPCAGCGSGSSAVWADPCRSDHQQPPGCSRVCRPHEPLQCTAFKGFDRGLPLSYSDCGIGEKPGFY